MILIELAGLGRMIGMGVIPAEDVDALLARGFFGVADVFGCDLEAVARRIVTAIHQRKRRGDFAKIAVDFAAEQRAAAFVRIGFRAVGVDFCGDFLAQACRGQCAHRQCSSQKRSLKYFVPESAKTVTITAC